MSKSQEAEAGVAGGSSRLNEEGEWLLIDLIVNLLDHLSHHRVGIAEVSISLVSQGPANSVSCSVTSHAGLFYLGSTCPPAAGSGREGIRTRGISARRFVTCRSSTQASTSPSMLFCKHALPTFLTVLARCMTSVCFQQGRQGRQGRLWDYFLGRLGSCHSIEVLFTMHDRDFPEPSSLHEARKSDALRSTGTTKKQIKACPA